jgi:putative lipoprotein
VATVVACGARNGSVAAERWTLAGQITYRERILLPSAAIAFVELVEAGGEASPAVAEDRIAPSGQVPIRFELEYAASAIDTARGYALRARIEDGAGRVLFETARPVPVQPWSARTVEILLNAARGTGPTQTDAWARARAAGAMLRAIGQEPGWTVEVYDDRIVLASDYGTRTETYTRPVQSTIPGGRRYTASAPGPIEVTVEDRGCADVMSGEPFPLTVTVVAAADTLRGCGRRLN